MQNPNLFQQLTADLSNRKAMNEDIISELRDDLLLQILSSLPTENATATSVLSKRWRSLWKMVPKLKFHQVSKNIYRSLTLHTPLVLESLHLEFESRTDWLDVGSWIATAFARRVRKLVLVNFCQDSQILLLPSVLFTYNDTLEILKLKYSIDVDFPSRVCLKSLRKLCLYQVHFKDEESVSNLFCGCPSLEDLVVRRSSMLDVATFTIAVPSLQRLTLEELNIVSYGTGCYVINAPALKYLDIKGLIDIESCLIEKAPELVEAKLSKVYDITNDNILESLTSAKRLILHLPDFYAEQITVPTGKIFDQLVYLELLTHGGLWWELLLIMLETSPKLQILKLTDLNIDDNIRMWDYRQWNLPKCVPECLLFHLETFVWIGYNWQREDEKEVATYILKKCAMLEESNFLRICETSRKRVRKSSRKTDVRCSTSSLVWSELQIHATSCLNHK